MGILRMLSTEGTWKHGMMACPTGDAWEFSLTPRASRAWFQWCLSSYLCRSLLSFPFVSLSALIKNKQTRKNRERFGVSKRGSYASCLVHSMSTFPEAMGSSHPPCSPSPASHIFPGRLLAKPHRHEWVQNALGLASNEPLWDPWFQRAWLFLPRIWPPQISAL